MKTIQEADDHLYNDGETKGGQSFLSRNPSNLENDMNYVNRSGTLLEDSIAEPGRAPIAVDGLTDFLTEEYFKRYGIYTQDNKALVTFWKDHVSAAYREHRKNLTMRKASASQMQIAGDFNDLSGFDAAFGGYSDLGQLPGANYSAGKPGHAEKLGARGAHARTSKRPPKVSLPRDNF